MDERRAAGYPFIPTNVTPPIVERAEGCTLIFSGGREVIDAGGGAVAVNIGHGRSEVADKATGAPYLPDGGMAARVVAEALNLGVWVYPAGDGTAPDALLIGPPFTITEEEMDTVITVVGEAITEVCGD